MTLTIPTTPTPTSRLGVPVQGLHHFAYFCRDSEETRHFYEDILGCPLVHVIRVENLRGSGVRCPYSHFFFQMMDGSFLAFFDLLEAPDDPALVAPQPWTNHLALRVDSLAELQTAKANLQAAGVQVMGPIDHEFVESIYFMDPNGVRLELTTATETEEFARKEREAAHANHANWMREKSEWRARNPGAVTA
jgi:catechol 2,3-dioxygenase-like lactoylglutathione lyase family enzyme